jgi:hypothetical protein
MQRTPKNGHFPLISNYERDVHQGRVTRDWMGNREQAFLAYNEGLSNEIIKESGPEGI